MPTVSDRPRSAGSRARSATVSDRPRSASGGSSRRTSSAPRGIDVGSTTFGRTSLVDRINRAETVNVGAGPGFTPVRAVLNALSTPAYAIGNVAAGRPGEAARNLYTLGQGGRKEFLSDTLRERGMLPGGAAGTILGLVADIATDPVTYVSFGTGSAMRQAGRAAAKRADDIVLREGRRLTLAERGAISAEAAAERAAAPRALAVGLRVPFTRGRVAWLGESERIPKVAKAVGSKVVPKRARETVRAGAKSGGGAADIVNEVYQDVRRLGGVEMRDIERAARKLDIDIKKAERALRLERGKGGELIARHLDDPARHALPEGLEELSGRARSLLDDFHRLEEAAGVEKGVLENYVPHLLAGQRDRQAFERVFGRASPNQIDDPFFVKLRETPTLDEFIAAGERHGFRPELNIAKLIERRGRASVQARVKKALDDAIVGQHGAAPPWTPRPRPGLKVTPEAYEQLQREWREIPGALRYHKGSLIPDEIADALERVHRSITPTVRDPEAIEGIKRFTRQLSGRWKALALLSPGYHMRNLYDDSLRAYWAGARNPVTFTQAFRMLRGRGGKLTIRGRTYSRDDLLRLAESNGVIRTGWVRSEIVSSEDVVRRGRFAGPGRGPAARASQAVGDMREDTLRLGTFIELLKKGEDSGTAARKVREFLFDYGEVGAFVEAARRFWLPFVTFPSKAIPNTLREFARNPGRGASIAKTISASEELAGNPDMSFLPPWAGSSFAVPSTPGLRRIIGAPEDQTLTLNPERVTGFATLDLLDPRPSEIRMNYLAGLVTPFARVPVEAVTGYSAFRGRTYRDGERVYAPQVIQWLDRIGLPVPGYGPKRDVYLGEERPGYSPTLDTILRTLPIYGQSAQFLPSRSDTGRLGLIKYLAGLPVSPYDYLRGAYYAERFGDRK
jgi:hypothetical protein